MTRVDLQDRLCGTVEAAGSVEQALELAIRPSVRRDEAGRTVSQPILDPNIRHLTSQGVLHR